MIFPDPLEPGAVVRVVAPSSPFDQTLVRSGMAWLGKRYRVRFDPDLFARSGFLAGTDQRRLRELNDALADPEAGAVIAARGGYGIARLAPDLDLAGLRRAPKWIVGFSDVTALHLEVQRAGIASLHAHNVAGLGRGDAHARQAWLNALERPLQPRRFEQLSVLRPGRAAGPLAGGNLTVLFCAHAAGRLTLPDDAVLVLEDVAETSYRIDRMLTALLQSGALDRVRAVVLGEFLECSAGKYRVPTPEVLLERLTLLDVPILADLPVGHGRHNLPLLLGARAELDSAQGRMAVIPTP